MKLTPLQRKPDKWKPLAILFTILALATIFETYDVLTSATITNQNKTVTKILVSACALLMITLAILFWRKSNRTKQQ